MTRLLSVSDKNKLGVVKLELELDVRPMPDHQKIVNFVFRDHKQRQSTIINRRLSVVAFQGITIGWSLITRPRSLLTILHLLCAGIPDNPSMPSRSYAIAPGTMV